MRNQNFWHWIQFRHNVAPFMSVISKVSVGYLQMLKAVSYALNFHGFAEVSSDDFINVDVTGMVLFFKEAGQQVELKLRSNGTMVLRRDIYYRGLGYAHEYDYSQMRAAIDLFLRSTPQELRNHPDVSTVVKY